ncbi:MAG: PepSY domain-containing protein [Phenylobacterium sp.]|uniref:PepSY-associated TM helix domain-containing protein n=1 Tax=Phenylobacterium sp. TaxID=1871053 RepID=UPI0025EBFB72|nr:PepSY-associated TM helix domain-containing protein [Phenylobacterium sp.]MBI1198786.1 PepSY domain-containing protein [Phenylobacterium sp.]
MTVLARLRSLWLDVHLWIGAGLLIVLAPLGVTGSVLVWHDPIDRALHAQRYATSGPTASRPLDDYVRAAQAAFAGRAQLTQIRMPQEPGDPVVAVGRMAGSGGGGRPQTINAWIDPPTARVLDTAETAKGFMMIMHRVHGTLMIPEVGRKVVGWLGWAMFVSCATGLWLWWPRRGGFVKGLRWTRGDTTMFNLHHMVGFWICIPLAVLSLTGVYISFPQTSRALFGIPSPPPRAGGPGGRFAPPLAQPRMSFGDAAAAALAAAPGELAEINAPTRGRDPSWRVGLRTPGAERPATIQVADATGDVRLPRPGAEPRREGGPDPVSRLMRQVHDGGGLGIVWQTVIFVAGLAPALLGITGVVMWLRRRERRRRLAEA